MEFEELEVIGRGSFGQIRKVRRRSDGMVLVRKEMSYKSMNQKEKSQLVAEFRILKSLVHPNIVQYLRHDHLQDQHVVHLYMEYCGGGDLAGLIRQCKENNELVPENVVWRIFTQLILALYRCHYNEDPGTTGGSVELFANTSTDISPPANPSSVILHRDIKPDNVFLDKNHSVKLGDFGLAKMLDQDHVMANTYVGTPYYMSPEVLMDQPYTPQSDIWSLGCVIYELCTLHPPFQAKSHLVLSQKIREGLYPAIPDHYSSTLAKTVAACINVNQHQRPTTATLLRLDVIKLCRRENELIDVHHKLQLMEQALLDREAQLSREFEAHKERLEQDIYNRLERELAAAIDLEVEKRVEIELRERLARIPKSPSLDQNQIQPQTQRPDQRDARFESPPPTLNRNIRGPRSIRDNIISPLRESRRPFDDITNQRLAFSNHDDVMGVAQLSISDADAFLEHRNLIAPSSPPSSYTSNWQTDRDISHKAPYSGIGAAAAKARLMGPKGEINRAMTLQMREDAAQWNEAVHGENMPSPFLKRSERERVL